MEVGKVAEFGVGKKGMNVRCCNLSVHGFTTATEKEREGEIDQETAASNEPAHRV